MSNATQDSRNPGDSRRRRSRGGSNRNRNQNQNSDRRGGDRDSHDSRNDRGSRGNRQQGNRAEEFRPQASRPARVYSPPKLSFWQKILKAIGLYKEPAAPARGGRNAEPQNKNADTRPPKSNTRNARSNEGEARPPREAREPRERREDGPSAQERPRRENRNNDRNADRPRGGDPNTVESPRVYVGNLSYDVSEQDLQELFKGIGSVRNIEIVYNRSTHRSKGYGFVEMLRMDEAKRAVEVLHDQPFMGRKMMVSGAKSKGQDEREDQEPRNDAEPKRVVLAPTNPPEVAAQIEAAAEHGLEEIPATAELPQGEEIASVSAEDLEAKYGFGDSEEKRADA